MFRSRRQFMTTAIVAVAGGGLISRRVAAVAAGDLDAPDALGVALQDGYRAQLIGATGQFVGSTLYPWHVAPDGGGTVSTPDGGWIYVSNSEDNGNSGGTSAIRFAPDGRIVDAYRIAVGLKWACAGGMTPWGTWLACEEFRSGHVWECDPTGMQAAVVRPAL